MGISYPLKGLFAACSTIAATLLRGFFEPTHTRAVGLGTYSAKSGALLLTLNCECQNERIIVPCCSLPRHGAWLADVLGVLVRLGSCWLSWNPWLHWSAKGGN